MRKACVDKIPNFVGLNAEKRTMTVKANAKINLGLNVVSKREDGYHNIESLFVPILGLYDEIRITASDEEHSSLTIDGLQVEGNLQDNLVLKAAQLVNIPPVSIHLHKNIPTGAGLGGGSSDAAATLKALNEMFLLGLSVEQMQRMLAQIGADCAFFVQNDIQFAEGIGERLTPIDMGETLRGLRIAIVKPNVFVSTREAFAGIHPRPSDYPILFALSQPIEKWRTVLRNDFEESVFKTHPHIGEIVQALYDAGAVYAQMSGSGSAVFGLFRGEPNLPVFPKDYFVWLGLL